MDSEWRSRIERLERQNRQLKWLAAGLAVIGLTSLGVHGCSPPQATSTSVDALTVKTLNIVDRSHRNRIALDESGVTLRDASGVPRLRLSTEEGSVCFMQGKPGEDWALRLQEDGGGLVFASGSREIAAVSITQDAHQLRLMQPNLRVGATLESNAAGTVLRLYDPNGKPRAQIDVSERGPSVALVDTAGVSRLRMFLSSNDPVLSFTDADGNRRIELLLDRSGTGFTMADADGKPRAMFNVDETAIGFGIADEQGQPQAQLIVQQGEAILSLRDRGGSLRARLFVDDDGPHFVLYDDMGVPLVEEP